MKNSEKLWTWKLTREQGRNWMEELSSYFQNKYPNGDLFELCGTNY